MSTIEHLPATTSLPSPRFLYDNVDPISGIVYPESDGEPMSDNTLQFEYIVKIHSGIAARFRDDPDVFVAGDLLWYPVEGNNKTRIAPDVLVAFGRPKGHRRSYLQWREGGVAPQVVFEVLSPSNTRVEMAAKRRFYDRFGVEEYYVYDPDRHTLAGWVRRDEGLHAIPNMQGWVSPRLGASFALTPKGALEMFGLDGRRFETPLETNERAEAERRRAEAERRRALAERRRAQAEQRRADEERRRADEEHRRAEEASLLAERLAAQLRAMGVEPEA